MLSVFYYYIKIELLPFCQKVQSTTGVFVVIPNLRMKIVSVPNTIRTKTKGIITQNV